MTERQNDHSVSGSRAEPKPEEPAVTGWPSADLERMMLRDAAWVRSVTDSVVAADVECHVRALLTTVRDQQKELAARAEILDAITAAAGEGNSWLSVTDWRRRLRDFANDREQHRIQADAWDANRNSFPGVVLYAIGGYYVGYFEDAEILWKESDDDLPMFHVQAESDPPHRTVIHPLHLAPWLEHLAGIYLSPTILTVDGDDVGEEEE